MNIEFKVVNHAANLNRTLSFDSDGHNILTKFMNCNNPRGVAFINFVRILYPYNQSYCVLFTNYMCLLNYGPLKRGITIIVCLLMELWRPLIVYYIRLCNHGGLIVNIISSYGALETSHKILSTFVTL